MIGQLCALQIYVLLILILLLLLLIGCLENTYLRSVSRGLLPFSLSPYLCVFCVFLFHSV